MPKRPHATQSVGCAPLRSSTPTCATDPSGRRSGPRRLRFASPGTPAEVSPRDGSGEERGHLHRRRGGGRGVQAQSLAEVSPGFSWGPRAQETAHRRHSHEPLRPRRRLRGPGRATPGETRELPHSRRASSAWRRGRSLLGSVKTGRKRGQGERGA